jgi:uncharacterized protein (TIGR02147 family)
MEIYEYLNYRKFLKDAYLERKAEDGTFTHASISKLAGLSSTGFFSWVLSGKRNISPKLAKKFAQVFNLKRPEAEYFELLVNYDQAGDHEEKNRFFRKIISHKKSRIDILSPDHYAYFSNWYIPVIRELIALKPFKDDFKKMAWALKPRITPDQTRKAVALLLKMGLIFKNRQGYYQHVDKTIATGDEWKSVVITNYQNAMMELGADALKNTHKSERDISTLTLSCSEELFETYLMKLQELRREFLNLARQDREPNKVFQVNFQLFPLTEDLGNGEKPGDAE